MAFIVQATFVFQSCSKDEENSNQPPTCKIIFPMNKQEFKTGEKITISVEANDSDGKVFKVKFFVNNEPLAATISAPFFYTWDTEGLSIGSYTLKATSVDNTGDTKSDEILVGIVNAPPTALFSVTPSIGSLFTHFFFNAFGSNDNQTPTSQLQVRWDFDGNGLWDTNWDTGKKLSHQYSSEGTYNVMMEVKDSGGLTNQFTKSITVDNGNGGITGTFTDPRDGQTYITIEIGSQTWFAENLNYESESSWWYDDDPDNGTIYGRLYKWDAAINACPSGWHLPSDEEWKILEMALGMSQSEADSEGNRGTDEGEKMKSTLWWYDNNNGTNSSGFNGVPGGIRESNGTFYYLGHGGYWWTATTDYSALRLYRSLLSYSTQVGRSHFYKPYGISVRCLKD